MLSGAVEWSGTPQETVSTQVASVCPGKDVFLGGFVPTKEEWLQLSEVGGELEWGKLGSSELGCRGLG